MKTVREVTLDPLLKTNPVTVRVLGICSLLAVTAKLHSAVIMAAALIVISGISSLTVSLLRRQIPCRIRMIIELCIVATLVLIADMFIKAYFYTAAKELSIYVGLIITNCIIMGRLEGFALNNPPLLSLADGISNGLGYALILIPAAALREFAGYGSVFGRQLFPRSFHGNNFFITPAGGFIVIALFIWLAQTVVMKLRKNKKESDK